jgi:carbonic anhydrase
VAKSHVQKTMKLIYEKSPSLAHALDEKKIDIIGAFYDVSTGRVEFFEKHQGDI